MAESVELETWKSVIKGRQEIMRLRPGGLQDREMIRGGATFTLSPIERQMTEEKCRTPKVNPFRNGMFTRMSATTAVVDSEPPAPVAPFQAQPTPTEPVQLAPDGDSAGTPQVVPGDGVIRDEPAPEPETPAATDADVAAEQAAADGEAAALEAAAAEDAAAAAETERLRAEAAATDAEVALSGGQPAALVENADDVAALGDGDGITDEQIDELLGTHWKQAAKRIGEMTAPWTLRRVHERALDRNASDAVKKAIVDRLDELGESLVEPSTRTVMPPIEPPPAAPSTSADAGGDVDPRTSRPPGEDPRYSRPGSGPEAG